MKAFRKKPVIISVSCLLAAVLAAGGIVLAVKNSGTPVPVAPVSTMNSGYWNDNSDIAPYGNVTTNLNQDISYDESLIITQVYVQEGDTVQVGDPLVMGNLMLAAHSLGLGSCWINRAREEFETQEGKALLKQWGIEGDYIGIGHCVIGYPDGNLPKAASRKEDYIVTVK